MNIIEYIGKEGVRTTGPQKYLTGCADRSGDCTREIEKIGH